MSPRIQRAHRHTRLRPEALCLKCVQSVLTETDGFQRKRRAKYPVEPTKKKKKEKQKPKEKQRFKVKD